MGMMGAACAQSLEEKPKRVVLDRIMARVNGANVLLSDLVQRRINDDKPFDLERAIAAKLYHQEAIRKDLLPKSVDIEKRIASLKSAANISDVTDDVFEREHLLKEGFTLKSYKREMARLLTEGQLIGTVQQERIFITSDEIKTYYAQNPLWKPVEYSLALAHVTAGSIDEARAQKDTANWSVVGWLKDDELAQKFKAVASVEIGSIIEPIALDSESYQLVKLVDKKEAQLVPLEHRYTTIERELRKKKAQNFEKEYLEELKSGASIIYFDPLKATI